MSKVSKKEENLSENENELIKNLKNDTKLRENPDFRMQIIAQAGIFVDDLANNMYRTSIELNSLDMPYNLYSIDAWKEFLNHPIVRKYIKSFRDEKINMMADTALAEGDKSAISIKKAMQEGGPAVNNSNLILIRLPEKKDWDD